MTESITQVGGHETPGTHALLRRWPSAIGLLAAVSAFLAGPDRTTVGIVVGIASMCYLTAAALGRPWTAWAAIPVCSALIIVGGLLGTAPLTLLAVTAAVVVVIGVLARASRRALTAEAVGALVYGGVAVIGLGLAPTAGLVLVAIALIAHGAWDAWHLRRKVVVSGSLAEFCIALDVPLGLSLLVGLVVT
ncbi:hypothetical protein [Actinopolymorpha alba]|uniref:hypothetical protein n=1 Tax=Actinopolymorpha alba TaxID=533267 RepID=UPI0007C73229|nr:hypothetical protein [Actinopolymorpha alba]